MRLLIALAAVLLAGCIAANVQQLRDTAPSRTATVPGDYARLAGCVAEEMQMLPTSRIGFGFKPGNLIYQLVARPDEARATVVGFAPGGIPPQPVILLAFRQEGAVVAVESRLGRWRETGGVIGAAEDVDVAAWPVIERCAGQKVAVEPPIR